MKLKQFTLASMLAMGMVGSAQAVLLTDSSIYTNWTVENFNSYDPSVIVPPGLTLAGGAVRLTSTASSEVGAIPIYNLGDNGYWGAYIDPIVPTNGFIGSNFQDEDGPTAGTLSFRFLNGPVRTVGALFNVFQVPGATSAPSFTITALDSNSNILESYIVSADTSDLSVNEGVFYGIARTTADISRFTVTDGSLVVDDLRFAVAPIPEPGEYAMMLAGLGMLGLMMRRRRQ